MLHNKPLAAHLYTTKTLHLATKCVSVEMAPPVKSMSDNTYTPFVSSIGDYRCVHTNALYVRPNHIKPV